VITSLARSERPCSAGPKLSVSRAAA